MTSLSQDEITTSTKTIVQGLDTLKNEHHQILNGLLSSMKTIKRENGDTNLVEEKTNRLKKSLETIELGLNEAHVSNEFHSWHGILHYICFQGCCEIGSWIGWVILRIYVALTLFHS